MMLMGRREALSAYLAVAVSVAWYFRSRPPRLFFSGGSPKIPAPSFLSQEQVENYHKDGYILLRGFIPDRKELKDLMKTGQRIQKSFSILDWLFAESYSKLSFQEWRNQPEFASLVFESSLPSMSAQLLSENKGIRVLKDALFAQTGHDKGCGWHVDDVAFWPATTNGVTAWLALSDDMQSLRLAPGSHRAPWAMECRDAIANNATCEMETLHPICNDKLESTSVAFAMQPGDMLLWDRWLFHRSNPMATSDPKARYSVRFVPQGARVRAGARGVHSSVQVGEEFGGAYYPQVWPQALPDEVEAIHKGLEADFSLSTLAIIVWVVAKREIPKFLETKWKSYF